MDEGRRLAAHCLNADCRARVGVCGSLVGTCGCMTDYYLIRGTSSRYLRCGSRQVTAPSEARQTLVALLVLAAVLVLLPMAPEASETVATPPPNVFL